MRKNESAQMSEVTIDSLMKNLEESEMLCSLDKDQKIKDDLEQISINKSALQELDNQEKRIQELTQIVSSMRREKQKRDYISNKCRVNNQNQLEETTPQFKNYQEQVFKGPIIQGQYECSKGRC